MKNLTRMPGSHGALQLPLPVPETARAGVPLELGSAGLRVVPMTDRATPEIIASGRAAQGLKSGEASCILLGITTAVNLGPAPAGVQPFAAVSVDAAGALAAGGTPVGWLLPSGEVALAPSTL